MRSAGPRSAFVAAALLAAALATGARAQPAAAAPLPGWMPERDAAHRALLDQARAALERGDTPAASAALERAAAWRHDGETELLIVQALMQRGAYADAAAFAAHTAGAHPRSAGAAALYVWLTAIGGQTVFAARRLDELRVRQPDDAELAALPPALAALSPTDPAEATPLPAAVPMPIAPAGPARAQAIGSGLRVADGRYAVVAIARPPAPGEALWVRDGRGLPMPATLRRHWPADGLALLAIGGEAVPPVGDAAPAASDGPAAAPRAAFAGSALSVIGFAGAPDDGSARWPVMRVGFLSRAAGSGDGVPALGVVLPPQPPGAPVFDLQGRVVGLTRGGAGGSPDAMTPLPVLQARLAEAGLALPQREGRGGPAPTAEQLYARALPWALQVLAAPAPGTPP